jgi:hypothetical protein
MNSICDRFCRLMNSGRFCRISLSGIGQLRKSSTIPRLISASRSDAFHFALIAAAGFCFSLDTISVSNKRPFAIFSR